MLGSVPILGSMALFHLGTVAVRASPMGSQQPDQSGRYTCFKFIKEIIIPMWCYKNVHTHKNDVHSELYIWIFYWLVYQALNAIQASTENGLQIKKEQQIAKIKARKKPTTGEACLISCTIWSKLFLSFGMESHFAQWNFLPGKCASLGLGNGEKCKFSQPSQKRGKTMPSTEPSVVRVGRVAYCTSDPTRRKPAK